MKRLALVNVLLEGNSESYKHHLYSSPNRRAPQLLIAQRTTFTTKYNTDTQATPVGRRSNVRIPRETAYTNRYTECYPRVTRAAGQSPNSITKGECKPPLSGQAQIPGRFQCPDLPQLQGRAPTGACQCYGGTIATDEPHLQIVSQRC